MKARWLLNLALLLAVGGIAAFLYLRPKPVDTTPKEYTVSNLAVLQLQPGNNRVPDQKTGATGKAERPLVPGAAV